MGTAYNSYVQIKVSIVKQNFQLQNRTLDIHSFCFFIVGVIKALWKKMI